MQSSALDSIGPDEALSVIEEAVEIDPMLMGLAVARARVKRLKEELASMTWERDRLLERIAEMSPAQE